MATTEILPFGTAVGANVMTPSAYSALPARSNGFSAGIAESIQLNTVWRQSAFMAAALANFLVSQGVSQPDDGDIAAAVANIQLAFKTLVGTPNVFTGATTTGSANAQVLASVTPSSGFALNNGFTVIATAGFTNTGATTYNVAGTGVQTVQKDSGGSLVALSGGEINSGQNFSVTWNSTAGVWVLQTTPPLGSLAYLNAGFGLAPDGLGNLQFDGTMPTYTVLTSGSSTYNTPAGCVRIEVEMVAGGGGGGGNSGNGAAGGNTTFGSWTALAGSGALGADGWTPGAGGSGGTNGTGTLLKRQSGAKGAAGNGQVLPSIGGGSYYGGAGTGAVGAGTANGNPAIVNTGSGGAGCTRGPSPSSATQGGGGAGEYAHFVIDTPDSTYAYSVGASGAGGSGSPSGGNGGSGHILIKEFYY